MEPTGTMTNSIRSSTAIGARKPLVRRAGRKPRIRAAWCRTDSSGGPNGSGSLACAARREGSAAAARWAPALDADLTVRLDLAEAFFPAAACFDRVERAGSGTRS